MPKVFLVLLAIFGLIAATGSGWIMALFIPFPYECILMLLVGWLASKYVLGFLIERVTGNPDDILEQQQRLLEEENVYGEEWLQTNVRMMQYLGLSFVSPICFSGGFVVGVVIHIVLRFNVA